MIFLRCNNGFLCRHWRLGVGLADAVCNGVGVGIGNATRIGICITVGLLFLLAMSYRRKYAICYDFQIICLLLQAINGLELLIRISK